MILKTFDEILTLVCDAYDSYNVPYKVRRSNSNTMYLFFKAVAKGYEVINNVATLISNKFNPATCSDFDLESTAKIAGTARLLGTGSGLQILSLNNALDSVTLSAGEYQYTQSSGVVFLFTVPVSLSMVSGESKTFVAFTDVVGSFPVTAQTSLPVLRSDSIVIPIDITFSCLDNGGLLGYPDESSLDFRKRINTDTTRQDTIKELEIAIRNLPYIFDCKLLFNNTDSPIVVNGVTVPVYQLLVILNGDPRDEIATMITSKGIFPTVQVSPSNVLYLYSDVFSGGRHPVYYTSFLPFNYTIHFTYLYDSTLISEAIVEETINTATNYLRYANTYKKYVTEDMFYNIINDLNIVSLQLLEVGLYVGASKVPYFAVPVTQIPILTGIVYNGSSI